MNDEKHVEGGAFAHEVGAKEARKLKARRRPARSIWFGFGMFGLIGWSVVVPTLVGAFIGRWLDARHPGGRSWTLALLVAGLVLGCLNAWRWVEKERKDLNAEEQDKHD
jgi:ATP synthase protein I